MCTRQPNQDGDCALSNLQGRAVSVLWHKNRRQVRADVILAEHLDNEGFRLRIALSR